MQKSARFIAALAIALLCWVVAGRARADELCAENYPTRVTMDGWDGPSINLASVFMVYGVNGYYQVYGHWPSNWAEVESAGLFQSELFDYFMNPINPDDASVDAWGDLAYFTNPSGGVPSYATRKNNVTIAAEVTPFIAPMTTYSEMFTQLSERGFGAQHAEAASSVARLKQFALGIVINAGIRQFITFEGHVPGSWSEFNSSLYSPVGVGAFNPYDGSPLMVDGSANDYKFFVDGDEAYVYATDDSGNCVWMVR